MARRKKVDTWSEAEARARLDDWRRSGQNLTDYSKARGFTPQRVNYWRRRLEAWGKRVPAARATLVRAEVVEVSTGSSGGSGSALIHIAGGVRVELRDASATWIATVAAEIARSLP